MKAESFVRRLNTRGESDVRDITSEVLDGIAKSGVQTGTATVFVPGSTAELETVVQERGLAISNSPGDYTTRPAIILDTGSAGHRGARDRNAALLSDRLQ